MNSLLTRRLPSASAVLVGQRIITNSSAFSDANGPLPANVDSAVKELASATAALHSEEGSKPIFALDRVADKAIGAFAREIEARAVLFVGDEHIPLTAAEKQERDAAELLTAIAFSKGLSFLNLPYGTQYVSMVRLLESLDEKTAKAAVKTLRLESSLGRIETIVKAYGEALGVGATQKSAGSAAANDAWHEAYEGLLVLVLAAYRRSPLQAAAEAAFSLPYTEEADRLRAADRKARRTKKNEPIA